MFGYTTHDFHRTRQYDAVTSKDDGTLGFVDQVNRLLVDLLSRT